MHFQLEGFKSNSKQFSFLKLDNPFKSYGFPKVARKALDLEKIAKREHT